jgi:Protein of unknown function (DUF2971)
MKLHDYFYKYQPIGDKPDDKPLNKFLEKQRPLNNLLNCQAVFSSRKNFNDLFDSKIYFKKSIARELKELRDKSGKNKKRVINEWIKKGNLTEIGKERIEQLLKDINKGIDNYLFYCVSGTCTNNLMWSHYANSHKGFCIEFKSSCIPAEKVTYQKEIATIDLIDFVAISGTNSVPDTMVEKFWQALKVKLKEWEYEDEYRFQLSNSHPDNNLKPGEKFKIVPNPSDWVQSVIFGCRMAEEHKISVAEHLPYAVEFKQAVEDKSSIIIKKSDFKTNPGRSV